MSHINTSLILSFIPPPLHLPSSFHVDLWMSHAPCPSSSIYLSPTVLFPHSLTVVLSFKIISCNFTFHTPFLHFQNVFISCTAISTHTTPSYPSLFCNLYLCNFIYIAHKHAHTHTQHTGSKSKIWT